MNPSHKTVGGRGRSLMIMMIKMKMNNMGANKQAHSSKLSSCLNTKYRTSNLRVSLVNEQFTTQVTSDTESTKFKH